MACVDSFGERSESCDGSPQPLAVENIAKTSARLELIIVHLLFVLSCSMHSAAESVQAGRSRRQDRRGLRLGGRRPEMG